MVVLQPARMLSLNEHSSIDKDKTPVNPWTPLFKTYTALPKIVSTELWGTTELLLESSMILSDRLQAKSDLTFTDAAHMSRQAKAIKQNWTIVRGVETQNEVDCISQPCSHHKQKATNNQPVRNWNKGFMKEPSKNDSPCFWCGRQNHDRK